jgi:hypothetical protein
MMGRLRRPHRPLQVIGVLAAVLSIAAVFLLFPYSSVRADARPISTDRNLGEFGERLNAYAIPIVAAGSNTPFLF